MLAEILLNTREMLRNQQILLNLKQKTINIFSFIMGRFYPIIHVIGDSHIFAFEGQKFFLTHPLGPATAYNLRFNHNTTNSKEKLWKYAHSFNKRSILLIILGEIDCRIHIYNQFIQNQETISIRELIQKTVKNYCIALKQLKKINRKVMVLSIPPAGYLKNNYKVPYYGSQEIRSQIHKEFNILLREECQRNNIMFVDIYKYVVDEKGLLRKEYAQDEIHLKPIAVKFFFEELSTLRA